jgi:DNA processing protein
MNTLEGRAWRALAGAKGVGPRILWLIANYLSGQNKMASWLLENPGKFNDAFIGIKTSMRIPDFIDQGNDELEKFTGQPVTVLHPLHQAFPQRIRVLKDSISLPALLYVKGNVSLLNRPSVAIVGKRNAGAEAIKVADSLASELAGKGINITSGYAAGIDAAAHLAALRAGGTTSIILAEGIAHFQTKAEFRDLMTEDNFLVISQFQPDVKWAAYMAMTRNKLVGALSGTVVVVVSGQERDTSGRNSGTFNAGISALKMGIPVFVVTPGHFADNPEGNRQLVAKGCRAWNPASGSAPILAALNSATDKKPLSKQLNLFSEK